MDVKREQTAEARTLNLQDLLEQFFHFWYAVIAIIAVCILTALFYTKLICTPLYDSTAKIYIGRTTDQKVTSTDFAISNYLARDYAELIADRAVLAEVIDRLDLKMSVSALRGCITIDNPENTRIIEVKVRTADPRNSMQIAECVCEVSQDKIVELLNTDAVNIISDAYMPTAPSSPNLGRNLLLGGMVGIALSLLLLVLASFFNDKLRSVEDVEKYLGLSVLATIPYANGGRKKSYGRKATAARGESEARRGKANV